MPAQPRGGVALFGSGSSGLGRMADSFAKQEIPTVDGRAFDGLLFGFEDLVSPFITQDTKDRFINLKSMSRLRNHVRLRFISR